MTYEEQQAILRAMSSFGQNYTAYQTAQAKHANELNKLKFMHEAETITKKHTADTVMKADLLKNEITKNDTEIVKLLDDFDRWNFNYESWTKLDDNYKTKEGSDMLKSLGIEYGEGFRLRESIAKDKTQQLGFRENLIGEQRKLLDDMYGAKTQIKGLAKLWEDKVVDTNDNLIKDRDDVLSLMESMPETFIKDYDPELTTEQTELNELAMAFLTPKKFAQSGKQYGFIDESKIAALKKAKGKKVGEGLAASEKADKEMWESTIEYMFSDIEAKEVNLAKIAKEGNVHEFLEQTGGTLKTYAGTKDKYNNPSSASKLYDNISGRIFKLMNWDDSAMSDMPSKPGSIRAMFESYGGTGTDKEHGVITTMYDQLIPGREQAQKYGDKTERWATVDMEEIDLSSKWGDQELQEEILHNLIKSHKMLEERYPELALKGIRSMATMQTPITTDMSPSDQQAQLNLKNEKIQSFVENNRERLYRKDIDEKLLKRLGIYDLWKLYKK